MDKEFSKAAQVQKLREDRYERWTAPVTKLVTPTVDNVTKNVTVTNSVTPNGKLLALRHENELLRARIALLEAELEKRKKPALTAAERKRKSRERAKDERGGGAD